MELKIFVDQLFAEAKKVGFVECEAYYHNPMDDVLYFKEIL